VVGGGEVTDVDVLRVADRYGGPTDVAGEVSDQLTGLHVIDHVDSFGTGVQDPVALQEYPVGVVDVDNARSDIDIAVEVRVEIRLRVHGRDKVALLRLLERGAGHVDQVPVGVLHREAGEGDVPRVAARRGAADPQEGRHVVRREHGRGRHVVGGGLEVVQRPAGLVEEELARRVQELKRVHDLVATADLEVAIERALGDSPARLLEQCHAVRAVRGHLADSHDGRCPRGRRFDLDVVLVAGNGRKIGRTVLGAVAL
jgi:hypothetical protein